MTDLDPKALEALKNNQRQLDMDGVFVGVSRQALHMLIDAYEALATRLNEATTYAERLVSVLHEKHWRADAPQWKPLSGDLVGILTQIDNMTAGLIRAKELERENAANISARNDFARDWKAAHERADAAEARAKELERERDEILEASRDQMEKALNQHKRAEAAEDRAFALATKVAELERERNSYDDACVRAVYRAEAAEARATALERERDDARKIHQIAENEVWLRRSKPR